MAIGSHINLRTRHSPNFDATARIVGSFHDSVFCSDSRPSSYSFFMSSPSPPPAKKQRVGKADILQACPPAPLTDDAAAPALLTADRTWAMAEKITSQMPSTGIPLTILTGFLGAGKSTILNFILRAPHSLKFAVMINEFGDIDIDSSLVDTSSAIKEDEPVTLDNGCICCTISNGFLDAVQRILDSSAQKGVMPDYFIVETTGLADPRPIIDSIQETELREEIYVDQVLTAVDSSSWTTEHYQSPTALKQIENADTVLLTKTDLVSDPKQLDDVIDHIYSIRPNARVLRSQAGYVPVKSLFDLDIALRAKNERPHIYPGVPATKSATVVEGNRDDSKDSRSPAQNDAIERSPPCKQSDHDHKPGEVCHGRHADFENPKNHLEEEGFSSISFTAYEPLSLRRFREDFMEQLPRGVFRAKGLLWFNTYESRFTFHWSGSRYNVEEGDWPLNSPKMNQLVVIGRDLDHEKISSLLNACIVQPGCNESAEEDLEYKDIEGGEEDVACSARNEASVVGARAYTIDRGVNGLGHFEHGSVNMNEQQGIVKDSNED